MIAKQGFKLVSWAPLLLGLLATGAGSASAAEVKHTDDDEAFQLPRPFPQSSFLDEATRAYLDQPRDFAKELAEREQACPEPEKKDRVAMAGLRKCQAQAYYQSSKYQRLRSVFAVTVTPQTMGGVDTEVFEPEKGVAPHNQGRVLINLQGGGFVDGSRTGSHRESIPIASVGGFKVVSVDYRMAPEYAFPAATEDAVAVYRELLKTYPAKNIGMFGCSSGGLLTAQTVAWLQKENLPLPGAVGLFCEGAGYWMEGDSGELHQWLSKEIVRYGSVITGKATKNLYFKASDPNDPLVFPVRSPAVMSKFPPTLLITGTRDLALSSVVHTHSVLVSQGVEAQLHVWEGLGHGFFSNPDLPASREMYEVTARFFDRHLGRTRSAAQAASFDANLRRELSTAVARFVADDKASAPAPCQVLFVGSSSIVKWTTLAHDMAPLPVINRGLSGTRIEDVNRWFDQLVAPYRPRAIVFHAGENDLDSGTSAEAVVREFDTFMARKSARSRRTPVYFIALKPSQLRFGEFALQTQVNNLIRARATERADLVYIDVATPMLEEGRPKALFESDKLHMTSEGYAIWTQAVREALLPPDKSEEARCRRTSDWK